jgi:hypothetical protein
MKVLTGDDSPDKGDTVGPLDFGVVGRTGEVSLSR